MATQVASLYGTLRLDDSQFNRALGNAGGGLSALGGRMQQVGGAMTAAITLPLVGAGMAAVKFASDFDGAMSNAFSILKPTADDMAAIRAEVLALGTASTLGPQAVADAYYNVVSGVQDASTHMDILQASIALAEAGQADLSITTAGLINTMNAYGLSAADAAHVSDVYTRTVGMGVGTMDEFVGALGGLGGLADDVGVTFDELGAAIAFSTTRGDSASESATQLRQAMVAFLNPNTKMRDALQAMGYDSGSAALEALGLRGAMEALYEATGSTDAMAQALGSVDALGAGLNLTHDDAAAFFATYEQGVDGATAATREFQVSAAGANFASFTSALQGAAIVIGEVLLPPLTALIQKITPLIGGLTTLNPKWIEMGVVAAGVVAAIGPVISVIGTIMTMLPALGAAFTVLTGPVGIAIALAGAFAAAYMTNFGGVKDFVDGTVLPALMAFFQYLGGVWEDVRPALESLYGWFVETGLPVASAFVTDTVFPAMQSFFDFIAGVWMLVGPSLSLLYGWFVDTGLPVIGQKIIEVRDLFDLMGQVIAALWSRVSGPIGDFGSGVRAVFDGVGQAIGALMGQFDALQNKINNIKTGFESLQNIGSSGASFDLIRNAIQAEFRAGGGPVRAGRPYIVGEEGPEMFVPGASGQIMPNEALGAMGGMNVSVQVTVTEGSARRAGAEFAAGMEERWRARQ